MKSGAPALWACCIVAIMNTSGFASLRLVSDDQGIINVYRAETALVIAEARHSITYIVKDKNNAFLAALLLSWDRRSSCYKVASVHVSPLLGALGWGTVFVDEGDTKVFSIMKGGGMVMGMRIDMEDGGADVHVTRQDEPIVEEVAGTEIKGGTRVDLDVYEGLFSTGSCQTIENPQAADESTP